MSANAIEEDDRLKKEYVTWLNEHLAGAKVHYEELCKLDDHEHSIGGKSVYYEQAHQMFGYIAALEKCIRQATGNDKGSSKSMTTKPGSKPKAGSGH